MKLFHYTAVHHLKGGPGHPGPGILRVGLLPTIHPYLDLAGGVVWLTDSPEWRQTWSTRDVPVPGFGPCNRTETRVEVAIPKAHRQSLMRWADARRFVITDDLLADLERYGDPEHWWVFRDRIPSGWLRVRQSIVALS